MKELQEGEPFEARGVWRGVRLDGKRSAVVSCPKCGEQAYLPHEIDEDGNVTPSLGCPKDGCDFHEWVQLVGWTHG